MGVLTEQAQSRAHQTGRHAGAGWKLSDHSNLGNSSWHRRRVEKGIAMVSVEGRTAEVELKLELSCEAMNGHREAMVF